MCLQETAARVFLLCAAFDVLRCLKCQSKAARGRTAALHCWLPSAFRALSACCTHEAPRRTSGSSSKLPAALWRKEARSSEAQRAKKPATQEGGGTEGSSESAEGQAGVAAASFPALRCRGSAPAPTVPVPSTMRAADIDVASSGASSHFAYSVRSVLYLYPHWSHWKKLRVFWLAFLQEFRHLTWTMAIDPRHLAASGRVNGSIVRRNPWEQVRLQSQSTCKRRLRGRTGKGRTGGHLLLHRSRCDTEGRPPRLLGRQFLTSLDLPVPSSAQCFKCHTAPAATECRYGTSALSREASGPACERAAASSVLQCFSNDADVAVERG